MLEYDVFDNINPRKSFNGLEGESIDAISKAAKRLFADDNPTKREMSIEMLVHLNKYNPDKRFFDAYDLLAIRNKRLVAIATVFVYRRL